MTDTLTRNENPAELLAAIARALADPAASAAALDALSERAAAAEAATGPLAADARQSALDPALPPERVASALAEANAATFSVVRLASAREALDTLSETRHEAEWATASKAARVSAIAERDRVAGRLLKEVPDLQAKLLDILHDLMTVNEIVDAANRDGRSSGEPIIQRPEGMVRGFHDKDELRDGGAPYNFEITRLVQMVVPDFAHPELLAWPPNLSATRLEQIRQTQPHLDLVRAVFLASSKGRGNT